MRKHPFRNMTKQWKIGIGILAVLVVLAGIVFADTYYGSGRIRSFFVQTSSKDTQNKQGANGILETIPLDAGSQSSFAAYGKSFLHCMKDGVKYYDSVGSQKWSDTFTMTSPVLVQEGTFMAVGDLNGKNVRVYDQNGLLYQVQLEGNLYQFAINENGYLSLIEKRDNGFQILIYNAAGTLLKGRVEESDGIFPISTDISDDNKSFAVSYVDTTDVKIVGKVLFFYINPNDSENHTDSMFASVMKEGEVMGTVSYGEGILRVVSDQSLYGISGNGSEKWSYPFTNAAEYISFQNKQMIVLAMGNALAGQEGRAEGTICWINNSGKETASYESGKEITYLSAWTDGVIAGSENDFAGLRHTGKPEWTFRAVQGVSQMVPMESFTKVLVTMQDQALILDMTKNTEGAGLTEPEAPKIEGEVQVDQMTPSDTQVPDEQTDATTGEEGQTDETTSSSEEQTQTPAEEEDQTVSSETEPTQTPAADEAQSLETEQAE